jgi:RimJ/RimL family protein N-acetyltransferase
MVNSTFYNKFVTLKNGACVLIRFLQNGDQTNVIRFFQTAPPEDTRYLTYFSANPRHLEAFLQDIDYSENIPLVALENNTKSIIGTAFFSRGKGAINHIGEVHCIFVARPFQKMGLGTMLLDECIYLACKMDIFCLTAKIVTELKDSINAFRKKGFETKTMLEKYFRCRNGDLCDVMLMTMPLKPESVEF